MAIYIPTNVTGTWLVDSFAYLLSQFKKRRERNEKYYLVTESSKNYL